MRKLYKNSDDAEQRLPTQSAAMPAWASLRSLLSALSLSRSLCGELGCCLRWVMAHESNVELDWPQRRRCSCSRRWRRCTNCHSCQLPAQSVQLFQLAIRNSPIRELPITWPWFCKQAGGCVGLQPNWHSDTRYGHLSEPIGAYGNSCSQQVIELSTYRAIDCRSGLCGTCHTAIKLCSISALSIYRFIDLSTYRVCLLVASTSAQRLLRRRWVTAACVGVAATRRVQKINKWIKNYRNRNWNWKCNKKKTTTTAPTARIFDRFALIYSTLQYAINVYSTFI